MVESLRNKKFQNYLVNTFPKLNSEIQIRFELGEPYPNGSDDRLNQVSIRVNKIFDSIFNNNDEIYLLVKDWKDDDVMFGNTTSNYIFNVLEGLHYEKNIVPKIFDADGEIEIQQHIEYIYYASSKEINHSKIFSGIANYEQGREPSIGQEVYFINMNKNLVFHMYDDRGCIVLSNNKDNIKNLYKKFNKWIVKYYKQYIDEIFKV